MSEMSDMFKLVNAMELAKKARVGMSLTYFDVIELLGEIKSLYEYIDELEAAQRWIPVSEPPKECEWKAYVPGWGAPTVNKRYLVKLINDWITIATYYLHVGGGYWKDDRGQELADGVVSLWKGLEE